MESKEVPSRAVKQDKYHSIFALAQKTMKAEDIIEITPDCISIVDEKFLVSVNGKTAELTFDEAKIFAKYLKDNIGHIKEYGVIFFGMFGKLKVGNLTKGFRDYLLRNRKLTLQDVGWVKVAPVKMKEAPINSLEDIQAILDSLK